MATSELMNICPLDPEQVEKLRKNTLPELMKTPDLYYESDIERFKTDDLYAHKFLAHQLFLLRKIDANYIQEKSSKMVIEHFKWRKSFGVKSIKKEEFPAEYFERKGCIMLKEDKEKRAVLIIRVKAIRRTKSGERPLGERFLIYWMENIYQKNDYGITLIIDCTDAGLSNVNMDLPDFAHFIFTYQYPCYLGFFLVYKMPWLFEAAWNIIKRFIPVNGIDRIQFVDKTSILNYIDKDKLPVHLGGNDTSEFQYEESLIDTEVLFSQKEQALVKNMGSLKLCDP